MSVLTPDASPTVTELLKAAASGDPSALPRFTPRVYLELRRMAAGYPRREGSGDTLQATALVHEVFLRGAAKRGDGAAHVMLDGALEPAPASADHDIAAIDDALNALARIDPRKERVVELRFSGGLGVEEMATVLKVSPQSVMRDWRMARAWLMPELVS